MKFRPFLPALFILAACSSPEPSDTVPVYTVNGEAQGTTYSVKYLNPSGAAFSAAAIDSVLDEIDRSLSVWVEGSVIARFNAADTIVIDDAHFITVFERGRELYELTGGAFNPMVGPLVRAWGFGPEGGEISEDQDIDALLALTAFDVKTEPLQETDGAPTGALRFIKQREASLDVNAYAQGYAVDVVADFLRDRGVTDMMVEIGGEVYASGVNGEGAPWRIGVDKPVAPEETRQLQGAVALTDAALATSGTYRKFYRKDGKKYSHTIDPSTGRPVTHNLLSVTVMAPNALNADALATAFLVKGTEGTKTFLENHPEMGLEVYLISDDGQGGFETYASSGMEKLFEKF